MRFHPLNRKVEPLITSIRIGIIRHRKIILILTDFKCSKKIPTLEPTIKSEIIGLKRLQFRFRDIVILIEDFRYLRGIIGLTICKNIPIGKLSRIIVFSLIFVETAVVMSHIYTLLI